MKIEVYFSIFFETKIEKKKLVTKF